MNMGFWHKLGKTVYMLSAAGVGAGCFYAFLFFAFNLGDSLLGQDNKGAAIAAAALAMTVTVGFLFLGRLLYESYEYLRGCYIYDASYSKGVSLRGCVPSESCQALFYKVHTGAQKRHQPSRSRQ
ncbi:hypothetical protein [Cohnella ginsengisoli]|nr:hypothetical protein [Cohnella ginsengisoli]